MLIDWLGRFEFEKDFTPFFSFISQRREERKTTGVEDWFSSAMNSHFPRFFEVLDKTAGAQGVVGALTMLDLTHYINGKSQSDWFSKLTAFATRENIESQNNVFQADPEEYILDVTELLMRDFPDVYALMFALAQPWGPKKIGFVIGAFSVLEFLFFLEAVGEESGQA